MGVQGGGGRWRYAVVFWFLVSFSSGKTKHTILQGRAGQEFLGFQICSLLESSVPESSSGNILRKGGKLETKGHGDKKVNYLINKAAFTWKGCQFFIVGEGI